MPKSQYIDPKEMRKAGEITFTPIPVNQYKKSVKDELKSKNFTKEDLKRIQGQALHQGRPEADLPRHGRDPRIRNDAAVGKNHRWL